MAVTAHPFRVIMALPLARRAAAMTWIRNNLDAGGLDWASGGVLSPTGQAPATHCWWSTSFTVPNCKKLFQLARSIDNTINDPATWASMTQDERLAVFTEQLARLESKQIYTLIFRAEDAAWPDPYEWLASKGLFLIPPAGGQ